MQLDRPVPPFDSLHVDLHDQEHLDEVHLLGQVLAAVNEDHCWPMAQRRIDTALGL